VTTVQTQDMLDHAELHRFRSRWATEQVSAYVLNEIELEYRRLLVLTDEYCDLHIEVSGALAQLAKAHLESGELSNSAPRISEAARQRWHFVEQANFDSASAQAYEERFGFPMPEAWVLNSYSRDPQPTP
jgi:hypothetical protein